MTEALRAGRPVRLLLVARAAGSGAVQRLLASARERGIPIKEVPREELDRRALSRAHQGVIALVAPKEMTDVDAMIELARSRGEPPLIVVAAEIQDPQNLGSLIRSAEAAGAHGLIFPRHRSAPLSPAVLKASAGAAEYLLLSEVTNLSRCLEELKERGLWVCGADQNAEKVCYEVDLTGPLALVVGGEGRGIPRLVRERCDFLVRIPMSGRVGSLNAAVAGAVLLFEILRQRRKDYQG